MAARNARPQQWAREKLNTLMSVAEEPDQNALRALQSEDFSRARELYGELVEQFPDEYEYACGFFTAGYWDNRKERIGSLKPGRAQGDWLVREWEQFQVLAEEKDFQSCRAFRGAMQAVLGRAAEQFRTAFQQEGRAGIDLEVLKDLAVCLIKTQDYKNASDILNFARRTHPGNADLFFLLGESLCSLDRPEQRERGMEYYRDAFLINHTSIDPTLISSEPAASIFSNLYAEKKEKLEDVIEWFPAYMMLHAFFPGLRRLAPEEIDGLEHELSRLMQDRSVVVEKFQDRVTARLMFFHLILLQHYRFHEKNPDRQRDLEEGVRELAPDIHKQYRELKI